MSSPRLRISVAPDGNVEFSVNLSTPTDPSLVASLVSAVRAGIVRSTSTPSNVSSPLPPTATSLPPPTPSLPPPTPPPASAMSSHRTEDGEWLGRGLPDRNINTVEGGVSVRQIAAKLERRSLGGDENGPPEPIKEFSSSPALWLTGGTKGFVDAWEMCERTSSGRTPNQTTTNTRKPVNHIGDRITQGRMRSEMIEKRQVEEEPDAWEDVDYEFTESYREKARDENEKKRGRWRWWSWGRKRALEDEDVYQTTLATGGPYRGGHLLPEGKRRRGGRFGRHADVWLQFSAHLDTERTMTEVGRITKVLGYEIWRSPGENRWSCVRRLNHRHEMQMIIEVNDAAQPHGPISVVTVRRARGNRNRVEQWRYSQFYRELIERLQRLGIEISNDM